MVNTEHILADITVSMQNLEQKPFEYFQKNQETVIILPDGY